MRLLNQFLKDKSKRGEYRRLGFVLFLGLINGLIFTLLVPPWQHYDEPLHFEYVWLIWDRHTLPQPGDYDQEMRRETAASMLEHGFYDGLGILPDLDAVDKPIWIGDAPQLSNPPLYYLLAATPSIFLGIDDVTNQLYAARFVSLVFFLVTILAGWGVVAELTPRGHILRLLLPMSISLSPGFTDLMTSVNNDTAAVVLVSLVLWGSIRMVMHGFSWILFIACIAAGTASFYSKEVAILSLPVFVVSILFSLFRTRWRWIPWAVLSTVLVGFLVSIISFDDARYWYRSTSQKQPTRSKEVKPVDGQYVFEIDTSAEATPAWSAPVFQPLPALAGMDFQNASFTIGAWIWADAPGEIRSPTFSDGQSYFFENISVGIEPVFYSFPVHLGDSNGWRAWLSLDPGVPQGSAITKVYYDGLVIVNESVLTKEPPIYEQMDENRLDWDGNYYINLIRNGSAEQAGIRLEPMVDNISAKYLPFRPSLVLAAATDLEGAGWMFKMSSRMLLRTFIGKFGWGHVPLIGQKPYRDLTIIILIGISVSFIWLLRSLGRKRWDVPWESIAVILLLTILAWGGALARGVLHMGVIRLYLPSARYAAVAIIPTMLIILWGWLYAWDVVINLFSKNNLNQTQMYGTIKVMVYFGAFIMFDVYAIFSIYEYYRGG